MSRCRSLPASAAPPSRSIRARAPSSHGLAADVQPERVESNFGSILRTRAPCTPASPLRNRATDYPLTPGSTFKVITTAAALDSGRYLPDSRFIDKGYCTEYGQKVHNFADQGTSRSSARVDFLQAFEHSINAVFCEIGQKIGATEILNAASGSASTRTRRSRRRPRSARRAASTTSATAFRPEEPDPGRRRPPRVRPGAENAHPLVTPLQMAMAAAGVANDGVIMRPYVVEAHHLAGRLRDRAHEAAQVQAGDQAEHRRCDQSDDAGGRDRRHRDGGADSRA